MHYRPKALGRAIIVVAACILSMIGRGAIVSANSVVHGMVPSDTIVAGAPAKPIKIFNSKSGSWDKA